MAKAPKVFAPVPMVPKAAKGPTPNQVLRQFATKPVVKPAKVSARSLTKAPADPLTLKKSGKVSVNPVPAANPLAPLKTYLP